MTLKISFKSLHVNACHLPFLLLCAEMVWKLRLDIRQKDGSVQFQNFGRMAGCVSTRGGSYLDTERRKPWFAGL